MTDKRDVMRDIERVCVCVEKCADPRISRSFEEASVCVEKLSRSAQSFRCIVRPQQNNTHVRNPFAVLLLLCYVFFLLLSEFIQYNHNHYMIIILCYIIMILNCENKHKNAQVTNIHLLLFKIIFMSSHAIYI